MSKFVIEDEVTKVADWNKWLRAAAPKESFEDFCARVLPMWSCCPFHKRGGEIKSPCNWSKTNVEG